MANPVNVSAKITVGFEDQFSVEACQAFETVKKCAEDAFKIMEFFPESLAFGNFQGDIDLFSQSVEKFESSINRMNESLIKGQNEANNFGQAMQNPRILLDSFLESMKQKDTFTVSTTLTNLAITLATLGVAALATKSPIVAIGVAIGIIGLNAKFLVSLLNDIEESLVEFEKQREIELKFSEDSIFQVEKFSSTLESFNNTPDFLLKADLLDNATKPGEEVRKNLEGTFKDPITQTINIETFETSLKSDGFYTFKKSPSASSGTDSDSFFSDGTEFVTSSPDLTGFSDSVDFSPPPIPKFSSGIERVPRDMLAMIHKDEAVLPKNRAEDFRRGSSSGVNVQKLEFNINAPNVLDLNREAVSDLALVIRDEIQRIDQRAN